MEKKNFVDRLTAFAAVIIAICALVVSLYDAYRSRKHDRLSVQPYVKFDYYYDKKGYHFTLDNWGSGPALIRWFETSVDGKTQKSWPAVIHALGLPDGIKFEQSIPAEGVLMQPSSIGHSVDILRIKRSPGSEAMLANVYKRITLRICYCSLYDECWLASSNTPFPEYVKSCKPFPTIEFGFARPRDPGRSHGDFAG